MRIISTINITNTFWFKSLKINKLPKLRDTLERRAKAKIKLRSSPVTLLIRLSVITMSTSPLKFQKRKTKLMILKQMLMRKRRKGRVEERMRRKLRRKKVVTKTKVKKRILLKNLKMKIKIKKVMNQTMSMM